MSWTARLPPAATHTYPAGSQTSSMASALRCVAVVLYGWSIVWNFFLTGRTGMEGIPAAQWCGQCDLLLGRKWLLIGDRTNSPLWPAQKPCRRCSRCQLVCRSRHRSEPPQSGTDMSGCLQWSVCAPSRHCPGQQSLWGFYQHSGASVGPAVHPSHWYLQNNIK